jgi:hypothetical protein
MRSPIIDKHLFEMMWERFPEIMKRGVEQPAQQEPVAIEHCLWARNGNTPCPHTTPPAAQCKPLTDAEIAAIVREAAKGAAIRRDGSTSERIARAVEAAHNIKENT